MRKNEHFEKILFSKVMKEYYWHPSEFFSKDLSLVSKKYAIIILNQPLSLEYNKFLPLWKKGLFINIVFKNMYN